MLHTWMLSSAQSCRNRSSRAERVLGPLALEAVRQQQHEAVGAQPLGLARGDVLVDDDLRAVGEVAELRFPQHQRLGIGAGEAVLEAEHAVFATAGCRRPRTCRAAAWHSGMYLRSVVLVDPDRVALAERAAARILARQAHAEAFGDEAAEGERLGGRPVEAFAALEHRPLGVDHAAERLVDRRGRRGPWSACGRGCRTACGRSRCRRCAARFRGRPACAARSSGRRTSRPRWACSSCRPSNSPSSSASNS